MKYENDRVYDINIAYIGGGSRGWAWGLMSDLADEEKISGNIRLYDIDFEAAKNNEIIGNSLYNRKDVKGKWKYFTVKTLEDTLTGADFIIISIQPGSLEMMASDVHYPEKYEIYQSVGDTTGPGGLIRALRTIPIFIDIAEKIKKYSPEAWVINYTNPMTLCTRSLYKAFPEIHAFGCCHEVFSTQMLMQDILLELKGIKDAERDEIKVGVYGINHFTWLESASYKGIDIYPLYKEFADKYYEEGFFDSRQKMRSPEEAVYFGCSNRVKFDLFKRYGIIAAAGDRHLAEFVPPWYLKNPDTVSAWKFGLTPMSYRVKNNDERIAKGKRLAKGEEEFILKKTGEEGVNQMKALLGLGDLVTNVNLPNEGQMDDFPKDAVVETNALFTKNCIQPVKVGKIPNDVKNIIMRNVLNQETIIEAVFNKDKRLAFSAFINDPLVTLDITQAKKLFNEMLNNTKEYLEGWDL